MKTVKPKCALCTKPCPCGAVHFDSNGEFVCWAHLDKKTKDRYPGADRAHELEVARIERARSNFGHPVAVT